MEKVSPLPSCATGTDLTDRYSGDPFPPAGPFDGGFTEIKSGIDTAQCFGSVPYIPAEVRHLDSRWEKENGAFVYIDASIKKENDLAATVNQSHLERWEQEYVWCQRENYRLIRHMIIFKIAFGIFFLSVIILIGVLFMIPAT